MRRRAIVVGVGLSVVALGAGVVGAVLYESRASVGAAVGMLGRGRAPEAARPVSPLDRLRPEPSFDDPPPPAGSDAAVRVLETLARVEQRQRVTRYQHATRVDERRGRYLWDCSGMAGWILRRSAPRARRALGAGRPLARRFARTIAAAPTDRARRGWRRLAHIREARPGDVFAWERPPDFPSRNTGHVGFVVNRPVRVREGLWAVPILDSTSYAHQDDTRGPDGGTGRGTMTFRTDGRGQATAYGWHGTESVFFIETPVVFGRLEG